MNRLQSSRFSHHRRKALSILAESGCGAQIRPINRAVERVPLRWRQLRTVPNRLRIHPKRERRIGMTDLLATYTGSSPHTQRSDA
jgi:hypothetical protein